MSLFPRRPTPTVYVGGVPVGSCHPVVVQSMTNTDTEDAGRTAEQVLLLARAGSELVRVTVNTPAAARAVPDIRARLLDAGVQVPLIGDFHYNGHLLLSQSPDCARTLDKYRVNPGNVGSGKHHDPNHVPAQRRVLQDEAPAKQRGPGSRIAGGHRHSLSVRPKNY